MGWLCEVCGYENQFDDGVQSTECLCCGESASEKILFQARQELDAYHRAERAKAYVEEVRRRRELRQQKIDHIVKRTLFLAKATPITVVLTVVGAHVWVVLSLNSSDLTFALWSQQMQSNMSALNLEEATLSTFPNGVGHVSDIIEVRNSKITTNMTEVLRNDIEKYNDNLRITIGTVNERQKNMIENTLCLYEAVDIELENIENQTREMRQRNFGAAKNFVANFQLFWKRATGNIDTLIEKIAERGADSDS